MKKSERKKIKLKSIEKIKNYLAYYKGNLAIRAAYKAAVKKQVPMPVKIQLGPFKDIGYFYDNNKQVSKMPYKIICQNCKGIVEIGTKYCPYCSQKLSWPSSWGRNWSGEK